MNQAQENTVERLRFNLRMAGITVTDADIQGMLEKKFLDVAIAFEEFAKRTPNDLVPDSLGKATPPEEKVILHTGEVAAPSAILELEAKLRARQVSPVELTQEALARIAEKDPQLNAFQVVLAEEALAAAQRAEEEMSNGQYRGVLHGIPVAVKDLFAMRDTVTTAGSKILANNRTDYDSAVVARLEAEGAIIIGKTRMSEFAYSPGSNNAHYGPTRNPRNPEYDTGGSSSGSGAAVAAGLVVAAIGTDTGGSIRIPSAQCGIVGLKPTFGRVSLYGGVTLAWSLDHAGPMTRTVADAALMLEILAGLDHRDQRTQPSTFSAAPVLEEVSVKGLRVGVLSEGLPNCTPEVKTAWLEGLAALEKQGAELVELNIPEFSDLRVVNSALLGIEATTFHHPYLISRLEDYGEFMRHRILAAYSYTPRAYTQGQQARALLRQRMDSIWQKVDVFSTPTIPETAPKLGTPGSLDFTSPFNLLGWPVITVPVGQSAEKLPFGLQLAGKPWDEVTILRAARVVEAAGLYTV